jgi:hypothetical protein
LFVIFALLEPNPDLTDLTETTDLTVLNDLIETLFLNVIIVQPRKCRRSEQRWSRRSRSSHSMWTRSPRRDSQRSELGIRIGDLGKKFFCLLLFEGTFT